MNAEPLHQTDVIYERFLARQKEEGLALAAASDLLELRVLDAPPSIYLAQFHCKSFVRVETGQIRESEQNYEFAVRLESNYLRRAEAFEVLRVRTPGIWHPNIRPDAPFICIRLVPGTPLVDILYELYEILTYQTYNCRDPLNREAAAWARANQDRFPIDTRPLKRRPLTGLRVRLA